MASPIAMVFFFNEHLGADVHPLCAMNQAVAPCYVHPPKWSFGGGVPAEWWWGSGATPDNLTTFDNFFGHWAVGGFAFLLVTVPS